MKFARSRTMAFILLVSQFAFGQSPLPARIQRVEQGLLPAVLFNGRSGWAIEERMKHYKIPGVSIAVINDFKVEWARGYGVKDVGSKEQVTAETLFQAGSISKPVAAMVALKKVEQGKILLDENINNRLTSWKLPDNEHTARKKVTLANLLSHTAGLTVHGFPGYAVDEKLPTLPQILDGAPPANTAAVRVNMEPGSMFRYSGGGSTIAQLAIMDIEKKPYPKIAEETVLKPLGMTSSTYEQPLPATTRMKAATGYKGNGQEVKGKIHIYPEMAAAGLWTTPTDLAKFGIEVQLSLQGKSNKVLARETIEKMVTPFIADHIGLGFFLEKRGKALYFGHGGADEGFRAGLLVHRDKGYGVAVMVNSDNGEIINEIYRSVAKEYGWEDYLPAPLEMAAVAPAKLDEYAGRFLVNPDRVLTVQREGGRLTARPTAEQPFELLPVSETEFLRLDRNIRYTFLKSEGGTVNAVKMSGDGGVGEGKRVANDQLIPYELALAGRADEAIAAYKKIKDERPALPVVAENRLNNLGYELMRQGRVAEAITIFRANVELYPQSANVYDSLGEAYMTKGDKQLAIKNYKRSLELNPKNENAATMLKKLEP